MTWKVSDIISRGQLLLVNYFLLRGIFIFNVEIHIVYKLQPFLFRIEINLKMTEILKRQIALKPHISSPRCNQKFIKNETMVHCIDLAAMLEIYATAFFKIDRSYLFYHLLYCCFFLVIGTGIRSRGSHQIEESSQSHM